MSQPTPQGAPTPPPAGPPAPTPQPPAAPPAPVPTPPAGPPSPQDATPAQPPTPGGEKTFTQADLDRILDDRMGRYEKSVNTKLLQAFGVEDPSATTDPAELLKQSKQETTTARDAAVAAVAEALAVRAGIKDDKLDIFIGIAKQAGLLQNVDLSDPTAKAVLKAAVDAKAGEFPEWKGGTLPASSGGDLNPGSAPTIDEQIATAEKNRDFRTAIALKREKASRQVR